MIDPAPTLVTHLTTLLPTLITGDELFDDSTFHSLGAVDDLEAPFNIVTYEISQQQDYTRYWQTDIIVSLHRQKPKEADYENTDSAAISAAETLLKKQCLESGAVLLRRIAEWFQTENGGNSICIGQFWVTKVGRASNSPQTTIVGDDNTYVHETRFTMTCDTQYAYVDT